WALAAVVSRVAAARSSTASASAQGTVREEFISPQLVSGSQPLRSPCSRVSQSAAVTLPLSLPPLFFDGYLFICNREKNQTQQETHPHELYPVCLPQAGSIIRGPTVRFRGRHG